jgi:hypothetical protein
MGCLVQRLLHCEPLQLARHAVSANWHQQYSPCMGPKLVDTSMLSEVFAMPPALPNMIQMKLLTVSTVMPYLEERPSVQHVMHKTSL